MPRTTRRAPLPALFAALSAIALVEGACVPTVRTPLKQALPAVIGPEAEAAICWRETATFPLPGAPRDAVLADFDRDGASDVAALAAEAGALALVFAFNDGRGGLARTTSLRLHGAPVALAAADLNLDGAVDLLVASEPAGRGEPSALHVLLGDGAGGFIAGATPLRAAPEGLLVTDLDSNGIPDALVIGRGGEVTALVGDGRGELKAGPRTRLPGKVRPGRMALGDFNGDRTIDLVTLHERGAKAAATLTILAGKGDGSFKAALRVGVGAEARGLASGDLNRDGAADLVALVDNGGEGSPAAAALLLGNGALDFLGVRYFGPVGAAGAELVDLDGDGFPDLVAARAGGDGLAVMLGDRRGGLGKVQEVGLSQRAHRVLVGDLDRDGRADLVSMSPERASLTRIQGGACGGMGRPPLTP